MSVPKEKTYYEHLVKILTGNETGVSGVYDDEAQAKQAALFLTRSLYGSESKASKKKSISGRGRIRSSIKGMSDLLLDLEIYIKTLAIDDQVKAKEYVESIIAQDSKTGIINTVKTVLFIKEQKVPESDFLPITTSQKIEQSTVDKIKGLWTDAKERLKYVPFVTILKRAGLVLSSSTLLAFLELGGILRRTPGLTQSHACVIGFVPLQHVREIEVARSGKVLKFRATGSVFLAKQEGGGDDAIRISGKFYRDELALIILLWSLYELGGIAQEEFDLNNPQSFDLESIRKKAKNIIKVNTERAKPSSETHKTFPFVSRHVIIPNVYIETLSFEEKIEDGINVIRYDILLRTYNKQKVFKVWNTDDPNTKYAVTNYDENLFFHKMFEYGINALWRFIQAEQFVVNTGSWKVGVTTTFGNPQARDVYYNIGVEDVIGTFAMGAMGFGGMKLLL